MTIRDASSFASAPSAMSAWASAPQRQAGGRCPEPARRWPDALAAGSEPSPGSERSPDAEAEAEAEAQARSRAGTVLWAARAIAFPPAVKLPLADPDARMVRVEGGAAWLTSRTIKQGTHGKIRVGLSHPQGQLAIIKSFHCDPSLTKAAPTRLGHAPVSAVPDVWVKDEMAALQACSRGLEVLGLFEAAERAKLSYAMTYMDGDLFGAHALPSATRLPVGLALMARMGTELGLFAQHALVHGDVKLENVLFAGRGALCLGDFDRVRRVEADGLCPPSPRLSTYPAPEVARGERFGPGADVWSLGVALWLHFVPRGRLRFALAHQPEAWRARLHADAWLAFRSAALVGRRPEPQAGPGDLLRELSVGWSLFRAAAPALARFVLASMLAPAAERCSAAEAAQMAGSWGAPNDAGLAAILQPLADAQPAAREVRRLRRLQSTLLGAAPAG